MLPSHMSLISGYFSSYLRQFKIENMDPFLWKIFWRINDFRTRFSVLFNHCEFYYVFQIFDQMLGFFRFFLLFGTSLETFWVKKLLTFWLHVNGGFLKIMFKWPYQRNYLMIFLRENTRFFKNIFSWMF